MPSCQPNPQSLCSAVRCLTAALIAVVAVGGAAAEQSGRYFARSGEHLPFEDDDAALSFLAAATVVSSEELPTGVTKPKRLVLEHDGVRARAIFHDVDQASQETKRLPNGRAVQYFRDSYRNQVAAYRVARLLGFDNVPPTLMRRSEGVVGSVQLWIEGAMMEKDRVERGVEHPSDARRVEQYLEMRIFDNIINNIDRNQTNILFDSGWNLWMIDHTRTFGRDKELPFPEMVKRCSRPVWEALQVVDAQALRAALGPYLGRWEIDAVIARTRKVKKLLGKRIEERGEAPVLFKRAGGAPPSTSGS